MATPDLASLPYCSDCGATRMSDAKFCPHCGCSFTGAGRAKGALPAVAPATRPLMPAVAAPAPVTAGQLDIEVLEGVKPFLTGNVVNLRPRTAPSADVDEPLVLRAKEGAAATGIGLGVTMLVPALISGASAADEPDANAPGGHSKTAPVAPMRMHVVTQAMARVDDADLLGPPRDARLGQATPTAPARAAGPSAVSSPAPRASAQLPAAGIDIHAIESQWSARLTSQAGLVDEATALATQGKNAYALGLVVTHMGAVFASAALVDDPAVLAGGNAAASHITRAVINGASTGFGRGDDVDVLAPGAPPQWQRAREPALHNAWADAAETMIPRKDVVSRIDDAVPSAREILRAPAPTSTSPAPEPLVSYVPTTTTSAAPVAPWASFANRTTSAAETPATAKPGSATMMMGLDALELRALADRLVQRGALSRDDIDAAKKK